MLGTVINWTGIYGICHDTVQLSFIFVIYFICFQNHRAFKLTKKVVWDWIFKICLCSKSPQTLELSFLKSAKVFSIFLLSYWWEKEKLRRRVSSVVEHSSANPEVPSVIPGPVSYQGHGLWWGMFHAPYSWCGPQLPKGCECIGFLSPMHKKIPDSYSKREGGNPGSSGLLSQQ